MEAFTDNKQGKTEFDDELIKRGIKKAPDQASIIREQEAISSAMGEVYAKPRPTFSMEEYRKNRKEELMKKQANLMPTYGTLINVLFTSMKSEIIEPSHKTPIVLILTQKNCQKSELLRKTMQQLAEKYPYSKFCEGNVFDFVKKIRKNDPNIPFTMIYEKGASKHTIGGLDSFGGNYINEKIVENILRANFNIELKDNFDGESGNGDKVEVNDDEQGNKMYKGFQIKRR